MSTIQVDSHNRSQQRIVENFYDVLVEDIVKAEELLEELDEETSVDPCTYLACRDLYDQELATGTFWNREDYINNNQKHV